MKKGNIIAILLSTTIALIGAYIISKYNAPKIAYVRSHDLIYAYEGTKEAQSKFNSKKEQWKANIDTLEMNFQKSISNYNASFNSLSIEDRGSRERLLQTQEMQLIQYKKAIDDNISTEDEEIMSTILTQINSYAEQYAKKQGYDYVLGTTLSGNILYANEKHDITDELLNDLNTQYRGE